MLQLLLVDDDALDRQAFLRMVRLDGLSYEVKAVSSVGEAVACLRQQPFDAVVADYWLHDGSALTLLDSFRAAVPFIIITGAGDEDTAVNALKAGAYDYIVKDTQQAYLKRLPVTIANVVQRWRIEEEEADQRRLADALRDTALALNSSLDVGVVLERILQNLRQVVAYDFAYVLQLEDDYLRLIHQYLTPPEYAESMWQWRGKLRVNRFFEKVVVNETPQTIDDLILQRDAPGGQLVQLSGACLAAPVVADDEVVGLLVLHHPDSGCFEPSSAERVAVFASQVGMALEHVRLHRQSIAAALVDERQRLARDLHDSVTQTLFAASVTSESLLKQIPTERDQLEHELRGLHGLIRDALSEMRTLLLDLRPDSLTIGNLAAQLEQLAVTAEKRGNGEFQINVVNHGSFQPPPEVKNMLFRIAQEALNNIVKHARAKQVRVSLNRQPHSTELEISDDGVGFDVTEARDGSNMGLLFMQERANQAGIALKVESYPSHGTRIRAMWPKRE
ncbi:MAG: histidine kinase [Anaerolineae bacterium]|nr:histidine kinase [Anaerolineae bacterium]